MELALALGLLNAFVKLAPIVYPKVQEILANGEDPSAFDWVHWVKFYGRSPAELQAEVDALAPSKDA